MAVTSSLKVTNQDYAELVPPTYRKLSENEREYIIDDLPVIRVLECFSSHSQATNLEKDALFSVPL